MNYSFWDTVKGQDLADMLITTLPKLVKEKKTKQYIKRYIYQDDFIKESTEQLELGSKIVSMVYDGTYVYVVYEREE